MTKQEIHSIPDLVHEMYTKGDNLVGRGLSCALGDIQILKNQRGNGNDWVSFICETNGISVEIHMMPNEYKTLKGSLNGSKLKLIILPEEGSTTPELSFVSEIVDLLDGNESDERQEGALITFIEQGMAPGGDIDRIVKDLS